MKDIRDRAEAARQYARAAGYSRDITNMCAEIKLRAERKAGSLLAEMPKQAGSRGVGKKVESHTDLPLKLNEIGVSLNQSKRWQQTARVDPAIFEDYIRDVRENDTGSHDLITSAGRILHDMLDTLRAALEANHVDDVISDWLTETADALAWPAGPSGY